MSDVTNYPLFKVHMPETAAGIMVETLTSGFLAEGPRVLEFTKLLSQTLETPHLIPTNSCTTALTIAYHLSGIGPGTSIISTPLTCVASNIPLLHLGATILWADCDPATGMLNPAEIDRLANETTKAVVILHKEGDLARLDEINAAASRHGLKVIEDAAHALGAKYAGVHVGRTTDYACFSFQAIKHITTGDGGLLVCKDPEDLERARRLKWFGVSRESRTTGENAWLNDIPEPGYKGNMNDIAAALGVAQMPHLEKILAAHHRNGHLYSKLLGKIPGITLVPRRPGDYEVFWAYALQAERRDDLQRKLAECGIASGQIHIRNDLYSMFAAFRQELPATTDYVKYELCLPCGWWMNEDDIAYVADVIKEGW